jgi:ribosomal protein S18 acetylase RimI-like enzyme
MTTTGSSPPATTTSAAFAYFAPEPFSDRMWNLYFIATAPDQHGSGTGTILIERVEDLLQGFSEEVARTLIVDTSSLDAYEQARAFYNRRGFVEEARIRDFYGPGDDKVTFWKRITA